MVQSAVTRATRLTLLVVVACTAVVLALTLAGLARASGYWNVWQGNLPGSDGVRSHHTLFGGGTGSYWQIRLSWDSSSNHDMHFSLIANNGSWDNFSAQGTPGSEFNPPSPYDRYVTYGDYAMTSGVAKAGCQNPSGLSTVFTNCRNAASL